MESARAAEAHKAVKCFIDESFFNNIAAGMRLQLSYKGKKNFLHLQAFATCLIKFMSPDSFERMRIAGSPHAA